MMDGKQELVMPRTTRSVAKLAVVGLLALAAVLTVTVGSPRAAGVFAPTITLETSTTRATAHPDARITIDNSASDENIKDLTLSLPDGFWGSLAAVSTKCTQVDAEAGDCAESSRVGTVTASALITDPDTGTEADGVLTGGVYLTEAFTGNDDPAGISIKVEAKVGGVDLGDVIVNGRVMANYAPVPVGVPTGTTGKLIGIKTVVTNIPQQVDDTVNDRQVGYLVERLQIDLISNLEDSADIDYTPPLLTNPSVCGTTQIEGEAAPYGGGPMVQVTDNYEVDGCETTRFDPAVTYEFSEDPIPSDTELGLTALIELPEQAGQPVSNSSFESIDVVLPRGIGANYPAFGSAGDMCAGSSAGTYSGVEIFTPAACTATGTAGKPEAKIGTASITTPMLTDPLEGSVYLINKTPLPWLGIEVSETTAGNPKGINFALAGKTNLSDLDPNCPSSCERLVTSSFSNIPDAPTTKIELDLNKPDRPNPPSLVATLSSKILASGPSDNSCQPLSESSTDLTSGSGDVVGRVQSFTRNDCPSPVVNATTGPWGATTTSTSPIFGFSYSGLESTLWCGIDGLIGVAEDCAGETSYSTSGLSDGTHGLIVTDSATPELGVQNGTYRRFAVDSDTSSPDVAVPETTLTTGPGTPGPTVGTTSDTTPSFTYNADETSEFQCSIDNGAFLPCGSATGTASETYDTPVGEAFEASDTVHTFEVRAQDEAGNVDLTPASASFTVDIDFAPQVAVNLTTTQARAHPEMTVEVTNPSHEDIDDFTFKLPDGFFGGLTGVVGLCPIANADAGTCSAGSKVGEVTTEAIVDQSTARIKGNVYLTEPRFADDPAGLTIYVTPKLQDVEFEPIQVNARLSVRGQAEGINTVTVDIPNTATTTLNEVSEFDLRKLTLTLEDNPSAPRPLLTNPSSCSAGAFDAQFVGVDTTTSSDSVAFQATGCELLSFSPQLGISMVDTASGGKVKPNPGNNSVTINLNANLAANPDGSGIKNVQLLMPKPVTVNVNKIPLACSIDQANLRACPAASAIGTVSAQTPLLPEALSGIVYMVQPLPGSGSVLPRLMLALRGRINVDIFATNKFVNETQLQTTMDVLPDAPISSFSMNINEFLTTRNETCTYGRDQWNITGTMGGFSGASNPVFIPIEFDCPQVDGPIFSQSYRFKGKGKLSTLTLSGTAQTGKKVKKVTVTLPRGFKFNRKSLSSKTIAKYVIVRGDNKKLKKKCFRVRSATKFEVNFCKKQVSTWKIQFRSKAFASSKKTKTPKFKVSVVGSDNKTVTAKKF